MPGIRPILGIFQQGPKKWRGQRIHIGLHLAQDMPSNELRRIFKHMNKTMEFTQHIIWNMA